MGYFPFYIDITNKKCLVVGGGKIALRKIEKLILFQPEITVIAPKICDEIYNIQNLTLYEREFFDSDLNNTFFVITATDSEQLNRHIFDLCNKKRILVNTVDDIKNCSFIFPSLVKSKNVTVGISTGGKSPIYAKYLRKKIENTIDINCDRITDILGSCRDELKIRLNTEEKRKKAFFRILQFCIDDVNSVNDEVIDDIIKEYE